MGSIPRRFVTMRQLRLLALLVPVLLLPAACEDSSSSSGGTFNPEGGAEFEAGPPAEAGPLPEAGADTAPPTPKGVTVSVLDALAPKKDVRVITHDAAGAITADLKTDATGKVTLATAPSMVTVLTTRGSDIAATFTPVTFMSVADGDNLVVDASDPDALAAIDRGKFNVSFGAPFAGATTYAVEAGASCTGSTVTPASPLLVDLYSYCVTAQNAVLVRATDGVKDLAYGFKKNVAAPAANGTAPVGPVDFVIKGATTQTVTNLPAEASPSVQLFSIANGAAFYANDRTGTLEGTGVTFSTATGFAEAYQVALEASDYENGGTRTKSFVRRTATTAPAAEALPPIDFATALPYVTGVTIAKAVPARADVSLTSAAPLTSADGAVAEVYWYVGGESSARWTFVLPPTTTTFKLPALPADAASFIPTEAVDITELTFVEATQIPGYKELKALPIAAGGLRLIEGSTPLPAAGTVRVSRWRAGD